MRRHLDEALKRHLDEEASHLGGNEEASDEHLMSRHVADMS